MPDRQKAIIHVRSLETILELAEEMGTLGLDEGDFGQIVADLRWVLKNAPQFETDYDELDRQLTATLERFVKAVKDAVEHVEIDPQTAGDVVWEASMDAQDVVDAMLAPAQSDSAR